MITVEAALSDLEAIGKGEGKYSDKTDVQKIVEIAKVLIKFLSTIRSNQLLTDIDKLEIKKAKAAREAKESKK